MKCCHCKRTLSLTEPTYLVMRDDGGEDEWCEDCDASLPLQLRPSLGYMPALMASINHGDTSPPGWAEMLAALAACADYLSMIPESAAGGDDDAVRLERIAREAIRKATGERA